MAVTSTGGRAPGRRMRVWAGHAAAVWAGLFAVRGVYWALGGSVGLGTLSQGIKDLHAAGDPQLFAALWMTVALEVVGVGLGLALVRRWGETFPSWVPVLGRRRVAPALLTLPSWGAGGLLVGHGSLFVSFGVRSALGDVRWSSEVGWYSLFWGPWFITGGVLFAAAAWSYLSRTSEPGTTHRRLGVAASVAGLFGGLLAAAAPLIVSAIAS